MALGKITMKQRSTSGDAVNEVLGYVNIDVMQASSVASIQSAVTDIITFCNAVSALTTNTSTTNNISYDVNLGDL